MATRFTRVTIAATDRQVDVSLPSAAPLGEQLPMVLRLLSIPASVTPRRWVLSTPELGVIPRSATLDDSGVLDGMVLHLTEAQDAALPPFVDDVEQTAGDLVAAVSAFVEGDRRSAVAGLVAVVLLGMSALSLISPSPLNWIGAAVAFVGALAIGGTLSGLGASIAAMTAVPAALAVSIAVLPADQSISSGSVQMVLLLVAGAALTAAGLVRSLTVAVAAGLTIAVIAAVGWIGAASGLQSYRTEAIIVVLGVIIAGLAGQLALGGAGLVNLLVADERGEKVPRVAVESAVRRGGAVATGIVWAVGIAVSAAVVVLVTTDPASAGRFGWGAPAFGGLGALVFALRSRMYSRVRQVVPMLLVPVAALVAAAVRIPSWFSMTDAKAGAGVALGVLVLVAVLVLVTGVRTLAEVPKARMRRLFEAIEFVAVLALVPGLLLIFDAIGALQRWIS